MEPLIFRYQKPYFPDPASVGICGTAVNAGVTTLCIALSNFLHSRYLSRTAYLEVNSSREISLLNKQTDFSTPFRHQGIFYYPGLTTRSMAEIMNLRYKYYILDFGVPNEHTFPEFMRCDHRIVVTNVSIWKSAELERFAKQMQKNNISWNTVKIIGRDGTKSDYARLHADFGVQAEPMPVLKDPFHITSGCFRFFEEIMKGE